MDFMVGQIMLNAFGYVPPNTLACNGQSVSISSQPYLFEVLGTAWGGDGASFNLPDLPPSRRRKASSTG